MKKKVSRLRLSKETLCRLDEARVRGVVGGLVASENPENPCDTTINDFTCDHYSLCIRTCTHTPAC